MVDSVAVDPVRPILLEGVGVAQIHPLVVHVVHHEVHAGKVVCGSVEFLTVEMHMHVGGQFSVVRLLQLALHREQERSRSARGV